MEEVSWPSLIIHARPIYQEGKKDSLDNSQEVINKFSTQRTKGPCGGSCSVWWKLRNGCGLGSGGAECPQQAEAPCWSRSLH